MTLTTAHEAIAARQQSSGAGRVAIVTGAGRGLGRAMALGLTRVGVRVVATAAREQTEIASLAMEAGEEMVLPLCADVSREEDVQRVVAAALDRFGRLDILINNAGRGMKYVSESFMTEPSRFWEVEPEVWRLVIDTNVNGPFLMARAAVPHMLRAGWGRIINISVSETTMRRRGFSPYGPSKAALESETVIWAQDLGQTGITVNALLPGGPTLTGMVPASLPEAARKNLLDPTVMVPPVLWLVSDDASTVSGRRIVANEWDRNDPFGNLRSS